MRGVSERKREGLEKEQDSASILKFESPSSLPSRQDKTRDYCYHTVNFHESKLWTPVHQLIEGSMTRIIKVKQFLLAISLKKHSKLCNSVT